MANFASYKIALLATAAIVAPAAATAQDREQRVQVIGAMQDPEQRVQVIGAMQDSEQRVYVIGAMQDPEQRVHVIGAMQDPEQRVHVIGAMQDSEQRVQVIGAREEAAAQPAETADASVPDLPVVYEDAAPAPATENGGGQTAPSPKG